MRVTVTLGYSSFRLSASFPFRGTLANAESSDPQEQRGPRSTSATVWWRGGPSSPISGVKKPRWRPQATRLERGSAGTGPQASVSPLWAAMHHAAGSDPGASPPGPQQHRTEAACAARGSFVLPSEGQNLEERGLAEAGPLAKVTQWQAHGGASMLGATEGTVLNSHPPRGHLAFSEQLPEAQAHHKARQRGPDRVLPTASEFSTDKTRGSDCSRSGPRSLGL